MKAQIPVYRAKKIDSDEYIIGWHLKVAQFNAIIEHKEDMISISTDFEFSSMDIADDLVQIDPTTLAINFPDMKDSEDNPIFASLSEDGKGGDKIKFHNIEYIAYIHEGQANISENEYLSKGTYDVNSRKTLIQLRKMIKVIGIQK